MFIHFFFKRSPFQQDAIPWFSWALLGIILFSIACSNTTEQHPTGPSKQPPIREYPTSEDLNFNGPPYKAFSGKIQQKIDQTCKNLGITHFVVRDQIVFVRKENTGEEVALHHYRPVMPNGYYYCTKRSQHKSNLE